MIVVVADDITGAAEVAGVCLRYGLAVSFGIESIPDIQADVCVIATDSRSMTEVHAYETHLRIAGIVQKLTPEFIFKKCDSALRGFVLTELTALSELTGQKKIYIQPSNPLTGRCIRHSVYYIDDIPLSETGFSFDPDFPAFSSDVIELLSKRSPLKSNQVVIENEKDTISSVLNIDISDCKSEEELYQIAFLHKNDSILAGSAAFFEQILINKGLFLHKEKKQPALHSGFLMVAGSTHPQGKAFLKSMTESVCVLKYFPDYLLHEEISEYLIAAWTKELVEIWKQEHKLIISISEEKINFKRSSLILRYRLSRVVQNLLLDCNVHELFIEGGATAFCILKNLNQLNLVPVCELSPGVIRFQSVQDNSLFVTLKPGSYNWPFAFV